MAKITYKIISIEKGGLYKESTQVYLKVEKTIKKLFRDPVVEVHIVYGTECSPFDGHFHKWYYVRTGEHLQLDDYDALVKCVTSHSIDIKKQDRLKSFKSDGF